ncbi:MAG: 50S ribosomal protein L23 [bacterium]|nr:50S ribosomal protein L23 [bacterium]
MNPYDVIQEAVFSERTTTLSEKENTYTFKVHRDANKLQIKDAVETAFNVKVADVRTVNVRPKRKMDRYRGIVGKTRRYKKALVKLAPGSSIEFA